MRYVTDSLIETVLARDVFQLQTVTKPALLRQLFALAALHPSQVLSYNKMLGTLQDAGNTVTLASYLRLLETAFLASGLELYSRGEIRKRGSSPKLILWNSALVNATSLRTFERSVEDRTWWGHVVENAVGAHLLNHLYAPAWSVSYWRRGKQELDFVVSHGEQSWALEVKSGRAGKLPGAAGFKRLYPDAPIWLVGGGGIPLETFFERPPQEWFA